AFQFRLLNLASAASLTPGSPVSAPLSPANSTAAYRLTANAGDSFSFTAQASSGLSSLSWRLVDPYGNTVFTNPFFTVSSITLAQAGIYTLLVEGGVANTGTGNFTFTVQALGNTAPTPASGIALSLGTAVTGSISAPGGQQTYVFSLGAASRLYFDTLLNVATDFTWTLSGPAGSVSRGLTTSDGGSASGNPVL